MVLLRRARWWGGLWLMLVCVGCTTVPASPFPPPKPFRTDGCSLFVDDNYRECCEVHDLRYWCGGTREQRREADRTLADCVADHGHPRRSVLMYRAVRIFAVPWLPTPWRWGFGWPYFRAYTEQPQTQCEVHDGH